MRKPLSDQQIVILGKPSCPWCDRVKQLLRSYGYSFSEFNVIEAHHLIDFLHASGLRTVPQVFADGKLIGGYEATKSVVEEDQGL